MTFIVRLKEDDPQFGMKAGDELEVTPYALDPDKFTVIKRVSDGYDPECNVYRSQVEVVDLSAASWFEKAYDE